MNTERRVRFTDDYVPGPKGCPVWGIERQWTFSVPVYIRAENLEEAWNVFGEFEKQHPELMDKMMWEAIKADDYHGVDYAEWYHCDPDKGWNK